MYEKSKTEQYAEQWFTEHGFTSTVHKQHISKTKYIVSKDGVTDQFELPSTVNDPKRYMEMYGEQFEMLKRVKEMDSESSE